MRVSIEPPSFIIDAASFVLSAAFIWTVPVYEAHMHERRPASRLQEFREGGSDYTTDWNAGVQLVVPLWDGGQTGRRVARAAAQRDTATANLAQSELEVREAVDRALMTLADSGARAVALARAADRLAEVARVQKLLLDVGSGTQVDYLAAEAELAATRANATEARTGALLAHVELARLTGELSPEWFRNSPEAAP